MKNNKMNGKNFSNKKLYELRKEKGLTQEQLAESIGVSRQVISYWEQGNCIPDLKNIIKLSEILNVDMTELVTGIAKEKDRKNTKKVIFAIIAIVLLVYVAIVIKKFIIIESISRNTEKYSNLENYYCKVVSYVMQKDKIKDLNTTEMYYLNDTLELIHYNSEETISKILVDFNNEKVYSINNEDIKTIEDATISYFPKENGIVASAKSYVSSNNLGVNLIIALNPFRTISSNSNDYIVSYKINGNEDGKVIERIDKDTGLVKIKSTYYKDKTIISTCEISVGSVTEQDFDI